MKYIIFRINGVGDFPVIFSHIVAFHVVGDVFGGEKNILSAGYADYQVVNGMKIEPRETLSRDYPNKPPKKIDGEILTRALENF